MEGIWAVIFVIALVSQVFKKFSETKGNISRRRESQKMLVPSVFKKMAETEEVGTSEYTFGTNFRENIGRAPVKPGESVAQAPEGDVKQWDSIGEVSEGIIEQGQCSIGNMQAFFAENNIINGIIMSELLQPPKCKRRSQQYKRVAHTND